MDPQVWMAIILGCVAAVDDLRRRVIPDWIGLTAIAGGLAYHTIRQGAAGLRSAGGGALLGFAVFLVFHLLAGRRGGDVKLMAPFGALLGPSGILVAALLASVIGGLTAVAALLLEPRRRTIRYGPAVVLGSWLALLVVR